MGEEGGSRGGRGGAEDKHPGGDRQDHAVQEVGESPSRIVFISEGPFYLWAFRSGSLISSKRKLGTALHLSHSSRNLIVKAESSAQIGDSILDDRGKTVGTVFDIFGPVSSPLVSVKPGVENPERYIGKELF